MHRSILFKATLRILQTLPDRIRQFNLTPCEAEIRNRKELEKIRAKQVSIFSEIAKTGRLSHYFWPPCTKHRRTYYRQNTHL